MRHTADVGLPPGVPSPASPAWAPSLERAVRFRLHALGATDEAADAFLMGLANGGVRNPKTYTDQMTDEFILRFIEWRPDPQEPYLFRDKRPLVPWGWRVNT